GSSNPQLCREFEALMQKKFQMSDMGELNFFLGLQVLQKEDGIFLSQDKYVGDILKKFGYSNVISSNSPMDNKNPWVKRIFRYLKGHPKLGLWYPKDSPFDLVAYSNSDYGGASQDRKSTSGGCQFLGRRLISWQCKKQTIVATSTTEAEYVVAASCCGQVLWIQNQLLNYRHHFIRDCFEKKLINVDHIHTDENVSDLLKKPLDAGRFQMSMSCKTLSKKISTSILRLVGLLLIIEDAFVPLVDFIEASPLRYALTFKPTIYVSHIRQFWSTARIKTTAKGTQILATVDGVLRTVTELSLRRNLKLQDEEGISSLPDTELFENLTLMGHNISPNQKFTFQKGQFSHQWKFLIHTIMQCLSPKSTGFNEFSSNIPTALVCLATNRTYNFSKMIFDGLVKNGEGSGTPTKPHHTPSQEAQPSSPTSIFTSSIPTVIPIPPITQIDTTPIRQYSRRARIAQSLALSTVTDEPASLVRDVSEGEACPTESGFIADQDKATIAKSSTLPHDSAPRVTSPTADEGSMQQTISELTVLCTSLQRQHSELLAKFQAQEVEILRTCPQQLAAATYSASVVDVATIVCFLHCQEMSRLPKNRHPPEVDLRS
nr:hypothetical protein [Tanacetum cinerariifolium]